MTLQIVSVGLKRFMNVRKNSKSMFAGRARLSSLLDALTMGVFQHRQTTANEKSVAIIPKMPNTRIAIPPALEYVRLARGKCKHFVLASLGCFPLGHSVQLLEPGIGLIEP